MVLDLLSWALILAGSFFCIVGGIGLLRLPDFYARTHAASIPDSFGALLLLAGLALQADGDWMVVVKLAMVAVFLLITSPTAGHALVKAAYAEGIKANDPNGVGS
jgi:multicomponent Na+:H+ antiporter subunit G